MHRDFVQFDYVSHACRILVFAPIWTVCIPLGIVICQIGLLVAISMIVFDWLVGRDMTFSAESKTDGFDHVIWVFGFVLSQGIALSLVSYESIERKVVEVYHGEQLVDRKSEKPKDKFEDVPWCFKPGWIYLFVSFPTLGALVFFIRSKAQADNGKPVAAHHFNRATCKFALWTLIASIFIVAYFALAFFLRDLPGQTITRTEKKMLFKPYTFGIDKSAGMIVFAKYKLDEIESDRTTLNFKVRLRDGLFESWFVAGAQCFVASKEDEIKQHRMLDKSGEYLREKNPYSENEVACFPEDNNDGSKQSLSIGVPRSPDHRGKNYYTFVIRFYQQKGIKLSKRGVSDFVDRINGSQDSPIVLSLDD